jgi:CheY-like chemotaxis protein
VSKRKLLLADDSITIQKVVNLTFADEGIEVIAVGNGTLAIEQLAEVAPDLVLADVHMPGLNGYEVCEQIRNTPEFADIPVMLLVGSFEPFDEAEAQRVGANDFLTKPFQSIKQLIGKVTELLDAPNGNSSNASWADTKELVTPAAFAETMRDEQMPFAVNNTDNLDAELPRTTNETSFGFADDDEMIETRAANNLNQSANFDFSQSFGEFNKTASFSDTETKSYSAAENDRQTAPLSFEDIHAFSVKPENPGEVQSASEWDVVETAQPMQLQSADFEMSRTSEIEFEAVEVQPFSFDTPNEETNYSFADEPQNEKSFDFSQTFANSNAAETAPEIQNETIEDSVADESNFAEVDDSQAAPKDESVKPFPFNFIDDDDFLLDIEDELQDTINAAPEKFTSEAVTPEVLAPENNSQALQIQSTPQTALEKPAESFNLSQMQFPPEVIDQIAQRVVERLSDKVIEKIAWEIVPERFDLIVRKQIQDKDRDR